MYYLPSLECFLRQACLSRPGMLSGCALHSPISRKGESRLTTGGDLRLAGYFRGKPPSCFFASLSSFFYLSQTVTKLFTTGSFRHASRQVIWNPIFGCMFFGYMGAVDGMGLSAISDKIKNNLWTSVSPGVSIAALGADILLRAAESLRPLVAQKSSFPTRPWKKNGKAFT